MEALREAKVAFEDATKTGDTAVIAKRDVEFHDIIIAAAGNERLTAMINNLAEQMYRYRFEYIKDAKNHQRIIEEHNMIFMSLSKKDKAAAANAVITHIDSQEKSIIQLLNP